MARLAAVELRKGVDTRGGRALLAAILLLDALPVGLLLATGAASGHTLQSAVDAAAAGALLLLPVVGILAYTTEFSRRTALVTFTLVPARPRVAAAKAVAAGGLAVASTVASLSIAVAAFGLASAAGTAAGGWSLAGATVWHLLLAQVLTVAMGAAFGLLVQSSTAAIVASYLVHLGWEALAASVPALGPAAAWLSVGRSMAALSGGRDLTAAQWRHLAAVVVVWLLVPAAVGLRRLDRRDIA
jgi:ABC-2 type transport system permease protein